MLTKPRNYDTDRRCRIYW